MNSLKTILMSSVAAVSLAAGPALAQETPDPLAPMEPEAQAAPEVTPRTYDELFGERFADWAAMNVEELLGKNVVDEAGENVGKVDSFALAGENVVAIVGVGGFLGLGKHLVAVPIDQFAVAEDQLILTGVTRADLQGLPEWNEGEPAGDEMLGADEAVPGAADDMAATDPAPLAPMAPGADMTPAEPAGDAIADAPPPVAGEAPDAAEAPADMAQGAGTPPAEGAGEPPADIADQGEAGDAAPPLGAEPPADATQLADDAGGWTDEMDIIFADIADMQIAELIGMPVASAEGEVVGEVDNFILDGNEVAAVVGIGGFLGVAEHDVALSLDEMTYDGEKLVLSSITGEQLRDLPQYDEAAANFLPEDGTLRSTYDAQ